MPILIVNPGLPLRSNPGLKLANAFGVVAVSMERLVQIRPAAEAEEAEKEYYQSLTPAQRIQIMLMLTKVHYGEELTTKFVRVCTIVKLTDLK